ncbi:MAG: type II toxin-antitoxin system VapC family toxin [bacterium]
MILLDTNILLRSKQPNSLHHQEVTEKLIDFASNDNKLLICPQVIYEFYVVATRPQESNGLGCSTADARDEVDNILGTYTLLEDSGKIFNKWRELVVKYEVKGKTVHDARLVAFMQAHQIKKLYTINKKDFKRYSDIIELV